MARRLRRGLLWLAAGIVLALVFLAYLRPDMIFSVASQIWACF